MGLLSKIGKGLKKLGSSIVKGFKAIVKPIRKALENKWVRGLLMAVTFFTGAGAIMAGFQAGGLSGGFTALTSHMVNLGVKVVRAPFDIIASVAKGTGSLLSGSGANTLGNFATNLGNGLSSRVDSVANAATNVFGLADKSAQLQQAAAAGQNVGTLGSTPGQAVTKAATPKGAIVRSAIGEGTVQAASQITPQAKTSLLSRAAGWVQDNPELTKIGVDALAGMTAPDEYTATTEMKDRDSMWRQAAGSRPSADPTQHLAQNGGAGLLAQLRRRNEELFGTPAPTPATPTGREGLTNTQVNYV